jgi:hypothetical protein
MSPFRNAILIALVFLFASNAFAQKVRYKKTQEVNFDEESVDGQGRKPEGLYITQKKTVDFVPLYKLREHFDRNIKDSVHYLR